MGSGCQIRGRPDLNPTMTVAVATTSRGPAGALTRRLGPGRTTRSQDSTARAGQPMRMVTAAAQTGGLHRPPSVALSRGIPRRQWHRSGHQAVLLAPTLAAGTPGQPARTSPGPGRPMISLAGRAARVTAT